MSSSADSIPQREEDRERERDERGTGRSEKTMMKCNGKSAGGKREEIEKERDVAEKRG